MVKEQLPFISFNTASPSYEEKMPSLLVCLHQTGQSQNRILLSSSVKWEVPLISHPLLRTKSKLTHTGKQTWNSENMRNSSNPMLFLLGGVWLTEKKVWSRWIWPLEVTCQSTVNFRGHIPSFSTLHFEIGSLTESGVG